MLKKRQETILKNVIEKFVKTGKPVGSSSIVESQYLDCSSATIRQEMSILEQLELLEQPYISGGRVPTIKGYQYYVDKLMSKQKITLDDKLKILFSKRNQDVTSVIEEASKIISEITNFATLVITAENDAEKLEAIQFNKLSDTSGVVLIITNQGNVQNKIFRLENPNQTNDLITLLEILNNRLKGTPIKELQDKINILTPIISKQIKNIEGIFQSFVTEMVTLTKTATFKSGTFNLVKYEDLDQSKIAQLIDMIENHSSFEQFVREQEKDILIGDSGTSIIKHEYNIKGSKGHIALIGPTRMEYEKINSLLGVVVNKIEKLFK